MFQQLQNLSASYKPQEKHALSQDLIRTTLRYSKDCQSFLAGAYRSGHLDTFEDQLQNTANLRLFNFDVCMSEYQHSKKIVDEAKKYLREWLIYSKVNQTIDSIFPGHEQDDPVLKFCFMFGSQAT